MNLSRNAVQNIFIVINFLLMLGASFLAVSDKWTVATKVIVIPMLFVVCNTLGFAEGRISVKLTETE